MSVFENPLAFLLLLAIPLYYVLKKMNILTRPIFPLPFADWAGSSFEWHSSVNSVIRWIARLCVVSAYISLVVALSSPTIVKQERIYTSRSSEVVFVVDISPSMAAMDIANGTRLEAAKKAIELLINENKGSAYGLVACASEAALLVPPTMDHSTLFTRLNAMEIGELGDKTSLGLGISSAVYHLVSTYAPKKTIVLLTDGENNAGEVHPETAAMLAKDYGITLYIAGIGTRGTVPIEYVDPESGQKYSGFLDSGFDNASLRILSTLTDGKYFSVESMPALSNALQTAQSESAIAQSYHIKQIQEPLYTSFLLVSIVLFSLAWIFYRVVLREVL